MLLVWCDSVLAHELAAAKLDQARRGELLPLLLNRLVIGSFFPAARRACSHRGQHQPGEQTTAHRTPPLAASLASLSPPAGESRSVRHSDGASLVADSGGSFGNLSGFFVRIVIGLLT